MEPKIGAEYPLEAPPLCSKVALADSVEDPLEAPPLCSKVALADSVEDPLEAPPLCSEVAWPAKWRVVRWPWPTYSPPRWGSIPLLPRPTYNPLIGRPEAPCCTEVVLREDLRLSLPERPCCGEVMLGEDLRLSLPERPCCREVVLQEDLRDQF